MSIKSRVGFLRLTSRNWHRWPATVKNLPWPRADRISGHCHILAVSPR